MVALSPAIALAEQDTEARVEQADANQENNNKENNDSLEVITVSGRYSVAQTLDTATGLGLTLRETPQSVSILTSERILDQNITTILEAVNNAVGVTSEETDNVRNSFYARGFRVDSYQIDGVPTSWSLGGDSGETVADTAIYERIEFVRGATGLLTGVGDPSASINLVRKHANSKELTGYVDVATGSWNKKRLTADVSTGLNEDGSIRGRVVGRYLNGESHVDYYEDNSNVFYGVIEADLSDSTLVRAGASYQHTDPEGTVWGALPTFFSDGTQADWDVSKTTAMDWNRWETKNTNYFASINHFFSNGWEIIANYNKIKYEKASKLLYVYGSLDKETGTGLNAQRYRSNGDSEQDSFDIQLKGDFKLFNQTHDFVLGALHSDQEADTFTQNPIGGDMSGGFDRVDVGNFYEWGGLSEPEWVDEKVQSQGSETEQEGYYAATRISATDSLKFIVGARVATWLRTGFDWSGDIDYGDEDEVIPYAGALYDISEQHRIYASYTEIFKPQSERDAQARFLDPLEGKSSEIGLKSAFLDDRLHTTLAVFKIEQDNLAQIDPDFVSTTPDQLTAYIPAQGTESVGFEVEIVGQPIDGWNITTGYSQYDAEDAQGKDINTDNPTKQFKLFTTYQFVDSLPELTVGGGFNWQNETYSTGTNPAGVPDRFTQDAYVLANLMARYQFSDALNVQFNAANITDEKYYSQVGQFSSYRYGTPRNFTVSVNYSF
ncbi:TonB-dependent siderophore receptor [Alteromonas pelagimontana]|uniref:TonB-dependent siderophore receptor n=2 Tax=Alteromonas pelagimontana TaxID=1858656 RepID=A0A6M4MI13_9ALTE|nr:TonB-dependent siderophore receptor [Alteromonas pelagimontana]